MLATAAVIFGVLFTVLGFSALVGLAAAKLYDWFASRHDQAA